jgi:folate-binding protein YgfZ
MTDVPISGTLRLDSLGVIRVQGPDAAPFLQGQLTHDFVLLGTDQARLAAYCNPKGRMQASFIGFKVSPDEIWLICSADLLLATLKRLSLFVLRAKVKLSDAREEISVWGLTGNAVPGDLPPATWHLTTDGQRYGVRLPTTEGVARALLVQPVAADAPAWAPIPFDVWQWLEVRSGVATVTQPLFELFVPQMLNYESVGGVNFKKGCYPGQEVVARSQFRGTLKRRTYLAHGVACAEAGQDVFHASDREQPCGTVVLSAANPIGGVDLLVSMQISAADGQSLTIGQPDGPALTLLPLPYPLLTDI